MANVSVVIPSYNAEDFIADAIASVLFQTYTDFEVIVVDDCSADRTAEIARTISHQDSRVRVVELSENFGGPAGPRNIGVSIASGRWICFLDADDVWHPRKLSVQLNILRETGAEFCSTYWIRFRDEPDPYADIILDEKPEFKKITFRQQCSSNRISNSGSMVADYLLKAHPFNESRNYHAVEDMQCWLEILEAIGECIMIKAPLIAYRINAQQISRNKFRMAKKYFMVVSNYELKSGRGFGLRKYLFFTEYVFHALTAILLRWKNHR